MEQRTVDPLGLSKYRALSELARTMLWSAGLDAQCDYVNPEWLAFTGRSLEQEVGSGWTSGVHPDDVASFRLTYLAHFTERRAFEMEYRIRRFDGVYRHILDRGTPFTDGTGACAGFVGSRSDTDTDTDTDHRRARDLLSSAHEFFEMSLDHLCVAGFDGYFKQVNPSWTRTLGWTPEELLSRPSFDFVHPDDLGALL